MRLEHEHREEELAGDIELVVDAAREPLKRGVQAALVVDAAFAQRRKTLRAALGGWAGSPARAEEILRAAGVDPKARGEQLTVADFVRIAAAHTADGAESGSGQV